MSTQPMSYSTFLDTRESGKVGTLASITTAASYFKADKNLRPSARGEKQSDRVAVTNYGGMISHTFEVTAEVVQSWAAVIAKYHTSFDALWDLTKEEFIAVISKYTAEIAALLKVENARKEADGVYATKASLALLKSVEELALFAQNKRHFPTASISKMVDARNALNVQIAAFESAKK